MATESKVKTIGILTSGGDAPGMNACIRSVVRYALNNGIKVKGIQKGYNGLLNDEVFDMTEKSVSNIIHRGGTVLYTARCAEFLQEVYQQKAADICRKHGIEGLVVIGGDGSFRGARDLSRFGINVVGVPGTIDLDIACTDYTIGFDTAANVVLDSIRRLRDTSASHERVSVIEVMGRHCGELALWAGITGGAEIILVPEEPKTAKFENILETIRQNREQGKDHNIIVVAEGIVADGILPSSENLALRIEKETGIESRATILGYVQRGGAPTAVDIKHATMMGAKAVELLMSGANNRVVAFKNNQYKDFDFSEALAMKRKFSRALLQANDLISNY